MLRSCYHSSRTVPNAISDGFGSRSEVLERPGFTLDCGNLLVHQGDHNLYGNSGCRNCSSNLSEAKIAAVNIAKKPAYLVLGFVARTINRDKSSESFGSGCSEPSKSPQATSCNWKAVLDSIRPLMSSKSYK